MKTIKILTLVSVLLFTGFTVRSAEIDSIAKDVAVEKLTKELKSLFKGMPINELICANTECKISICFKVDKNDKIEIIHVAGKNNELVEYSKKVFANYEIEVDKNTLGKDFYWIKMVFQNRSF